VDLSFRECDWRYLTCVLKRLLNYVRKFIMNDNISQAAQAIENAEALVIAAGAGMGVDSACPTFVATKVSGALIRRLRSLGIVVSGVGVAALVPRRPSVSVGILRASPQFVS
jgi:hypothetical protein